MLLQMCVHVHRHAVREVSHRTREIQNVKQLCTDMTGSRDTRVLVQAHQSQELRPQCKGAVDDRQRHF